MQVKMLAEFCKLTKWILKLKISHVIPFIDNEGICVLLLNIFKFLLAGTGQYFRCNYMFYLTGRPLVYKVNCTQKNGRCFFHRPSQNTNNSTSEEKVPLERYEQKA